MNSIDLKCTSGFMMSLRGVQLLQAILEWKELGFSLQQLKLIAKLEKNGLGGK